MPIPAAITTPPSDALRSVALRLGVPKLNCESCACGHEDNDGEEGVSIYCGMVCSKHEKEIDETYLEDADVEPQTEKSCWEPDFWKSNVPEIDKKITGSHRSMMRACREWRSLVESLMPKP